MRQSLTYFFSILITAALWVAIGSADGFAQVKEPPVRGTANPTTPLDKGYSNRIGANILVSNFGFGIGGTYAHALGPYTEFTFTTGITGIRDVSEQSFQDFFSGQRIVPNKYNRALGFPFLFGIKQRIFPQEIADNFRFFIEATAGPAMAFVYPYINDENGDGFRTSVIQNINGIRFRRFVERKNNFFQGLGDGYAEWGGAGELSVGVDLGSNLKRQSTLEIGFFFYYFEQGLQLLEPRQPVFNNNGEIVDSEPAFDDQKFFGTPQIKYTFSGWW